MKNHYFRVDTNTSNGGRSFLVCTNETDLKKVHDLVRKNYVFWSLEEIEKYTVSDNVTEEDIKYFKDRGHWDYISKKPKSGIYDYWIWQGCYYNNMEKAKISVIHENEYRLEKIQNGQMYVGCRFEDTQKILHYVNRKLYSFITVSLDKNGKLKFSRVQKV